MANLPEYQGAGFHPIQSSLLPFLGQSNVLPDILVDRLLSWHGESLVHALVIAKFHHCVLAANDNNHDKLHSLAISHLPQQSNLVNLNTIFAVICRTS